MKKGFIFRIDCLLQDFARQYGFGIHNETFRIFYHGYPILSNFPFVSHWGGRFNNPPKECRNEAPRKKHLPSKKPFMQAEAVGISLGFWGGILDSQLAGWGGKIQIAR